MKRKILQSYEKNKRWTDEATLSEMLKKAECLSIELKEHLETPDIIIDGDTHSVAQDVTEASA